MAFCKVKWMFQTLHPGVWNSFRLDAFFFKYTLNELHHETTLFQQEVNCNTHSQLLALSNYHIFQQILKALGVEKGQAKNLDTQKKIHLSSPWSPWLLKSCSELDCSNRSLCWIAAIHEVPIWHLKLDFLSSLFIMMMRDRGT